MIRERTNAGLQFARERGRTGGRPKGYAKETISKLLVILSTYRYYTKKPEEIYKPLGLIRATFCRYCKILHNHTDEEIKKMTNK